MNGSSLRLQLGRGIIIVFRLWTTCLTPSHQRLGLVTRLKDKAHSGRLVTAALRLPLTNNNNDLKPSLGVPTEEYFTLPRASRLETRFNSLIKVAQQKTLLKKKEAKRRRRKGRQQGQGDKKR